MVNSIILQATLGWHLTAGTDIMRRQSYICLSVFKEAALRTSQKQCMAQNTPVQ